MSQSFPQKLNATIIILGLGLSRAMIMFRDIALFTHQKALKA